MFKKMLWKTSFVNLLLLLFPKFICRNFVYNFCLFIFVNFHVFSSLCCILHKYISTCVTLVILVLHKYIVFHIMVKRGLI